MQGAHRTEQAKKPFLDKGACQEKAGNTHTKPAQNHLCLGTEIDSQLGNITGKKRQQRAAGTDHAERYTKVMVESRQSEKRITDSHGDQDEKGQEDILYGG